MFEAKWAIPENIHTPSMDDIGNPVGNAQWVWLEIRKFPQIFMNFNWNSRKTIQILRNSGIPQDFELAGSGILQKLQLSFLEILKILGTQLSIIHGRGDIFWNSPIDILFSWAYVQYEISKLYASRCVVTFKCKFLVLNPHAPIWKLFYRQKFC